jgi:hypothetical protein
MINFLYYRGQLVILNAGTKTFPSNLPFSSRVWYLNNGIANAVASIDSISFSRSRKSFIVTSGFSLIISLINTICCSMFTVTGLGHYKLFPDHDVIGARFEFFFKNLTAFYFA